MGDIYANAVVVLSADSANNVHEGFHRQRVHASLTIRIPPSERIYPKDKSCRDDNTNLGRNGGYLDTMYARPALGKDPSGIFWDHCSYVEAPTDHRAWCFQERRLARRIIYFAQDEIYWECGSSSTCECGQKEDGIEYGEFVPQLLARFLSPLPNGRLPYYSRPIYFWWGAVREFATRKLTKPTDRLPAIAGFASKLHCDGLGDYHAGMWKDHLPVSLLWVTGTDIAKLASQTYIGPTWS
jgi:hypothetical protein